MVKTRVHDLAAEFGVPSEQLLGMLREMNIFVRSHLSALEPDQVSAVRVRWEREKRKSAEPAAPKKGRRRKTAEPEPTPVESKPVRRRRTAAEVAEQEAKAQAEAEANRVETEPLEIVEEAPQPEQPKLSLEERARMLFKDLPETAPEPVTEPAKADGETEPAEAEEAVAEAKGEGAPTETDAKPRKAAPKTERPPRPESSRPTGAAPAKPFIPPRVPRPAAGSPPRGPRPKPVFSSSAPVQPRTPPGAGTAGGAGRGFGPDAQPGGGRRRGGKRGRKNFVDQDAVQANIEKTLDGMKGTGGGRKRGRSDEPSYRDIIATRTAEEKEREKTRIRVNEFISVSELADLMKIPANQIVEFAFKELGLMVTVNQRLDFDQIELIASEFGFEAVREQEYQAEVTVTEVDADEDLAPRPPVVTIMGHVDHGKTSLLDHIRKENIVAGEAGGITQHIGAYHVRLPDQRQITFLDTPGHQAFTAMRARGAQVTDIVVLVVAADDQVMPQTIEAITHAKNAGVPMVVAINKIDLPAANVMKVKQELLQHSVVLEEFGGTVLHAPISAKSGHGRARAPRAAAPPGRGARAQGQPRRACHRHRARGHARSGQGAAGHRAGAARHAAGRRQLHLRQVLRPGAGALRRARQDRQGGRPIDAGADPRVRGCAVGRRHLHRGGRGRRGPGDRPEAAAARARGAEPASARGGTLEDISRALKEGEISQLPIIIKADQGGPAEALADALAQLGTDEVRVDIVLRGVGQISESDILLAKASGAIILGFHVRPDSNARAAAEREGVDVRTYRVIYEAVEDVRNALEGLLKPEQKETVLGEAEVLELFKVSKVGTIAGCMVTSGIIQRSAKARVVRDGVTVYTGEFGASSASRTT